MKLFLISDNVDTQVGMRLAGIEGVVVHEKAALHSAADAVLSNPEIGILIFTEKAASLDRAYLQQLKSSLSLPLVVEIPDRHGRRDIGHSIRSTISDSIGLKL